GNISSFCIDEQDFTLALAEAVGMRLEATEHFDVRLSRERLETVEYRDRLADAAAWGADVLVSLHSDVRGREDRWSPEGGKTCPLSLEAPGFALLISDEGDATTVACQRSMARALSRELRWAGFPAYGGVEYAGIYELDASEPGVFADHHAPEKRIFVLRQ